MSTHEHLSSAFAEAVAQFDIKQTESMLSLMRTLDQISPQLAKNEQTRAELGNELTLWPSLRKIWRDLARAHSTFWEGDDSDEEENSNGKSPKQNALIALCGATARFTRNLVAGVPENQFRAFSNEPDLRRLLHYYTSWSAMEDADSVVIARILTQALSNMVTAQDNLIDQLWDTYFSLPEDQVVIIRLLGSPDDKTLLSTFIFIMNCMYQSRKRIKLLCKTAVGIRICICLLDSMLRLYEAGEGTEGAQAFDIGYSILSRIIEEGLAPSLYKQFTIPDEAITPHQTTLLKIIDSFLQSAEYRDQTQSPTSTTPNPAGNINKKSPETGTANTLKPEMVQVHVSLTPMLARAFFSLSSYAQDSIRSSLGLKTDEGVGKSTLTPATLSPSVSTQSDLYNNCYSTLQNLDVMLPKVCEALVLVAQCLATITIEAEEYANTRNSTQGSKSPTKESEGQEKKEIKKDSADEGSIDPKSNMKSYLIAARVGGVGIVESLIGLLRSLDTFLPRINFGQPVASDAAPTKNNATRQAGLSPKSTSKSPSLMSGVGVGASGSAASLDEVRTASGNVSDGTATGKTANDSAPYIKKQTQTPGQAPVHVIETNTSTGARTDSHGGRVNDSSDDVGTVTSKNHHGFAYLKRDLVRMLGVLSHDSKAVQDRVRAMGGIEVVMNMCVVDERNPYLREHAILTLRNLLKDNFENQRVVDNIKPMEEWDNNGIWRNKSGPRRR